MFKKLLRAALSLASLSAVAFGGVAYAEEQLTIYTYESFTADWGPGKKIATAFEANCKCKVHWVALADGVAMLNRLKLEGANSEADVVLGLDNNLLAEARATGLFAPHDLKHLNLTVPVVWNDDVFLPYDFGYFAVVYDSTRMPVPPASLAELVNGDPAQKIILEDPRTSTPGLGFLLWVKAVYGEDAGDAWKKLSPRILTVAPGWSEAYGLFTKGEAPMVLSYSTSPAYHIANDKETRFKAAPFSEGQYFQVEVAARTKAAHHPDLARQFLKFMLEPGFQDTIPTGNWMYPAAPTTEGLPPSFADLIKPTKVLQINSEEVGTNRKRWIDEWLNATSH